MTADEFIGEAESLRPTLIAVAGRYLGHGDEAEDAVQDALLKLWAMHAELRSPMAPLARVLVRNVCVDRLRRRHPTVEIADTAVADRSDASADEADMLEKIMLMVGELPSRQQVILRLRHIDGMDFKDIARLLGSTEQAVRKALSRARMALRDMIVSDE